MCSSKPCCNQLQTAPEYEVECPATIKVDFDDGATVLTNFPYTKVGSDAVTVAAGHHISKQHLKDVVGHAINTAGRG